MKQFIGSSSVLFILGISLLSFPVFANGKDNDLNKGKDPDPWRGYNEKVFKFNDFLDRALLKPLAEGYVKITPRVVRKSVGNFFSNLGEPIVFINDLLQAKPKEAGVDVLRFGINTTIGLGGLFDPATKVNLHKNNEDFGQTLGKWGVPSGPYLVIPFFPPTNVRDGALIVPVMKLAPSTNLSEHSSFNDRMLIFKTIVSRADLLELEALLVGDRYTGIREVLIRTREHDVQDGDVKDDFLTDEDDDWLDEE